jgi:hypothetical protein
MKNNLENEWNIIESESKWNFVDTLEKKDKIKLYMINKYNKISPYIYYSLQLCFNNNNNYVKIISNSINIINNNKLLNYTNDKLNIVVNPLIETLKLQYNYNQAFKYGFLNMINICYNLISPSLIEINNNLYNNYDKEIIIDDINKEFIIIYNNLKYIFIYQQFLLNTGFQQNLQSYIKYNIINLLLIFSFNKSNQFIIKLIYKL